MDAPDKAKEIADRIHEMDQEMERAIRMEAFDQMAEIKKQQDALVKKYDRLMKKREKQEAGNVISIGENEIAEVVAQWTKIPVQKLAEKESERLLKLEKTLHRRVIGQEEAVTAVARAMRRGRVGLKDPKRPIASFFSLSFYFCIGCIDPPVSIRTNIRGCSVFTIFSFLTLSRKICITIANIPITIFTNMWSNTIFTIFHT